MHVYIGRGQSEQSTMPSIIGLCPSLSDHDQILKAIRTAENSIERESLVYKLLKRFMDVTVVSLGIVLLMPLFVLVAILIRLDSKGPILFKQKRRGLYGKPFLIYKFRTMHPNAEAMKEQLYILNEAKGNIFKIRNDPRVTRVGTILRKMSIDELPQLFNVLKGEMSLIGPRAMCVKELDLKDELQWVRLRVKPGIICLREINGRSRLSFDEWMRYDLQYLGIRSIKTDVKVLMRAIPVVLRSDGAY